MGPASPYAQSKLVTEQILADIAAAGDRRAIALRHFDPIGAEPGLATGVHERRPSHVLRQLTRTALGQQESFTLTGTDLPTQDGTGLRDCVQVWDLAQAHVSAMDGFDAALERTGAPAAC